MADNDEVKYKYERGECLARQHFLQCKYCSNVSNCVRCVAKETCLHLTE